MTTSTNDLITKLKQTAWIAPNDFASLFRAAADALVANAEYSAARAHYVITLGDALAKAEAARDQALAKVAELAEQIGDLKSSSTGAHLSNLRSIARAESAEEADEAVRIKNRGPSE
jgi:hypothetical protein